MSIRPIHIWWVGAALFAPSIVAWSLSFALSIYKGRFNCALDGNGIFHIYLPLFAALIGFGTPLLSLRMLRHASWRRTGWLFAISRGDARMGRYRYPISTLPDRRT